MWGIRLMTNRLGRRPFIRRLCSTVSSTSQEARDVGEVIQPPPPKPKLPEVSLELLKLNHREQRIANILQKCDFAEHQISLIIRDFRENDTIYDIDPKIITESIKFWWKTLLKPKKSSVVGETAGEQYDIQDVISYECPRLLLINPDRMEKRVKALKQIGFLEGRNNLWTVFVYAPKGFFLQDWADFCQKFFYIQYRVLEFLIDKHKNPFPTPHPLVKSAQIMELPYQSIKARFEFLIKTGMKTPAAMLKTTGKPLSLNLEPMFLTPTDKFLKKYAPRISEEEFNIFEKMINDRPDDEDKILEEICELNSIDFSVDEGFIDPFSSNSSSRDYAKAVKRKQKQKDKWESDKLKRGRDNRVLFRKVIEDFDDEEHQEEAPHLTRLCD